jgi:hypothetical protein
MEQGLGFTPSCVVEALSTLIQWGDRKGLPLSMSSICGEAGCFNTKSLMDLHVGVC